MRYILIPNGLSVTIISYIKITMTAKQEFTGIRKYIFPINAFEFKKVIPACLMFVGIIFVYTIARLIKDAQIINLGGSGSAPLPYLKLVVFATTVAYAMLYAVVANKISKKAIFYFLCAFFLTFFVSFRYLILPNYKYLQLTGVHDFIIGIAPGASGLAVMIRDWYLSLFYVNAEIFGSIMISAEFYILANNISKKSEAKRFYAVFGLVAAVSTYFAGDITSRITSKFNQPSVEAWLVPLGQLTYFLVGGIIVLALSYTFIIKYVLTDPKLVDLAQLESQNKKPSLSFFESFKFLAKSPHMRYLAMMIFGYGLTINLIEVLWKDSLKIFDGAGGVASFQAKVVQSIAISSIISSLFISHNLMRMFSWKVIAIATPILISTSAIPFFLSLIFKSRFDAFVLSITGVAFKAGEFALYSGAVQNVIAKMAKYTLFDPPKEIVFINREPETKSKGKVAVDTAGARTAKSTGSLTVIVSQLITSSVPGKAIFTVGVITVTITAWMSAVLKLGVLMDKEKD